MVKRAFSLSHCPGCGFYFVDNPDTNYESIYDLDYYQGRGADPMIDYIWESENPQTTVRNYEWQGIAAVAQHFVKNLKGAKWLDYGCGTGGLLSYGARTYGAAMFGFEHGWAAERATQAGLSILSERALKEDGLSFDIITAIEVLEHCFDPISELRLIRQLLKPGGLFFYTTGNSQPFQGDILNWSYFQPEIHISLFQPKTMDYCLKTCGFKVEDGYFLPGLDQIIRYKILKNLGLKSMNIFEKCLPWPVLSRLVDGQYKISAYPIGRG